MRNIGLLVVVGCTSTPSPPPATDAAVDATSSCVRRLPFSSIGLLEIAVDGTSVLANSYDGLTAIPLDGSAPSRVLTVPPNGNRIAIASHAGVATYAIVTATATEVRRRDGTVIAMLPIFSRLRLARMTAADFYLLADTETTASSPLDVWRVPLSGGTPAKVTTVYGYSQFEVGTTIIALTDGEHGLVIDRETGDSLETFYSDRHYGMQVEVVADSVFALTGSFTGVGAERVERLHPAGSVVTDSIGNETRLHLFADDRYVYVTWRKGLPPATPWENLSINAYEPATLAPQAYPTCLEFRADGDVVFDETHLYGVQKGEGSNYDIVIAPRAP